MPNNQATFQETLFLIQRAWKSIVLFVIVCTAAAGLTVSLMHNSYDARVLFMISEPKLELSTRYIEPVKIRNYSELLTAETVLNESWLELKDSLKRPPQPFNRMTLEKMVDVTIHRDSHIVELSVRAADPQDAALIANTVAGNFIRHVTTIGERASRGIKNLISAQIEETTAKLTAIDGELKSFFKETGLTDLETERGLKLKRLDDLSGELTAKTAEFKGLTASISLMESTLSQQQQLISLKTYVDRKPLLANSLRDSAAAEEVKAGTLGLEETVVNTSYQAIWEKLAIQKARHAALAQETTSLQAEVLDLTKKIESFPDYSLRYRKLSGESDLYKDVLKELLKQFDEAKVLVASKSGDVEIVDSALPSLHPAAPKRLILIIFTFFCSFWCAVVAILLKQIFSQLPGSSARTS